MRQFYQDNLKRSHFVVLKHSIDHRKNIEIKGVEWIAKNDLLFTISTLKIIP
jgi:hypothetical protein